MINWYTSVALFVGTGVVLGIALAKVLIQRAQKAVNDSSTEESIRIIQDSAQTQRDLILEEAKIAIKEQYDERAARADQERSMLTRMQENFEQELNERQSEVDKFENTLTQRQTQLEEVQTATVATEQKMGLILTETRSVKELFEQQLESKSGLKKEEFSRQIYDELINTEKLGISRWLMDNFEALKGDAQKLAHETLKSVYLRYQPRFVWPKTSFTVALPAKEILQKHFQEDSPIIASLIENTDCALSALTVNEELPSMLKISGGAGVDKEIIRLTLEEMLAKETFQEDRVRAILDKYRKQLERTVLRMGEDAFRSLHLTTKMHPEILKLIGSLNYRTSHRQNQYYHSIEVARLAGMLADEVGVDAELAKRSGILHDIGKVLDYKIEGSHAVISGDYATRYGESENVVDTVLAHHDDKIVETPFAYILKAADAMSGARPGARVDMEEGYNRRIDGISGVVNSFAAAGVTGSAIMHAGREVHVYVDNNRVKATDIPTLAQDIAKELEAQVEYPGQIRVTVIRRTEITEVA